jgi:nucleotide-binding universal stress UspA family protein
VKEHGADLLVIGTQGKTGLGKLILGSVAENIIRTAPCSVLVVRKS